MILKLNIWKIGKYWQVQVCHDCSHCDAEPEYYFNEETASEFYLQELIKQALNVYIMEAGET